MMGIKEKLMNAKETSWPAEELTKEEVKKIVESAKKNVREKREEFEKKKGRK